MGQEILYCYQCQQRVVGTEFAKGHAFQVGDKVSCSKCAADLLQSLDGKQREQLLAKMFQATQERKKQSSTTIPAQQPAAKRPPTVRRTTGGRPSSPILPMAIGASVVVVGGIIAVMTLGATPRPPVEKASPPAVQRPAPPPPSPEETTAHQAARVAVTKARDFAARNPKDLEGQISLWRDSLDAAAGTPFSAEARRELDGALARRKDAIPKEWADLQAQTRAFVEKQQVQAAIDLLQSARSRYSAAEWTQPLDRQINDLHRSIAPVPAPPVPRPGKVVLAHDFSKGTGTFQGIGGAPFEIVDAEPGGPKAIAISPKGASVRGFEVVTRPSTVVRFRLKSMIDLDIFECISWIEAKQVNAWYHVPNLKKGEWRTVEFKLGELRFDYNGAPIMGATVISLGFYYLDRPDDSRVLLTDFELRD